MTTLAREAVEPHLTGSFGTPYLYEPECESTQALLLGSGRPEGAVAATEHQTAGRGRLGRRWEAPAGTSVLCSVMLEPPAERHLPELSIVGALAVAEAIELATDLSTQIKWPNDVMLNRKKVAGVLAELRDGSVVLGIGINVGQSRAELPTDTTTEPGSLRTVTGIEHDRAALLGAVLGRLERLYVDWRSDGLAALATGVGARNFLFGRRVEVAGEAGIGGSIAPDGRLEVHRDDASTVLVESGEIAYVA